MATNSLKPHTVITAATASKLCTSLRKEGKQVVFTNGCFDILHAGHVGYLEKAKSLGDVLLVGVNSDRSTRIIKGSKRPLIKQRERAKIISSLHCVDYVIIFDEVTPVALIKKLRPHVHVKGGDYKADLLPESDIVRSYGGVVRILPYNKGKSTSNIIKEIVVRYAKNK